MIKTNKKPVSRLRQGDIFKDVEYIEHVHEKKGIIEVSKIIFPLVIILTQDCDLAQDYKFRRKKEDTLTQDKLLFSVLVAPLYNSEHVFLGEHLSELKLKMETINKNRSPGKYLIQNERPRYHYLDFPEDIPVVPSIIDFKHYFSVHVNYLKKIKKNNLVCSISPLFRERVSQRFAEYLARIGLPENQ